MAQKLNIIIDQGTTFNTIFNVNDDSGAPLDLSGYVGRSQIRKHYTSSNAVSFDVILNSNGAVMLSLDSNTTNSMTPGRYVYDVEVSIGDSVSRIVEGIVTLTPQATR